MTTRMHQQHGQADETLIANLHDAMQRLPGSNGNPRALGAIQHFELQMVRRPVDSKLAACGAEIGQDGSEDCKAECTGRCGYARACRAGDSGLGGIEGDGSAAVSKG